MDFVCLDDSALRRNVLFLDSNTYDQFTETWGSTGDAELIKHIKSTFEEVQAEELTGGWKPPASTDTRVREWMRGKGMEVKGRHERPFFCGLPGRGAPARLLGVDGVEHLAEHRQRMGARHQAPLDVEGRRAARARALGPSRLEADFRLRRG
jgi:hypothetical protein